MSDVSKLPRAAREDPFKPPDKPVQVSCLHCGQEYSSNEMIWRASPDDERDGLWCCPTAHCDGAGFGFDIMPINAEDEPEGGDAA